MVYLTNYEEIDSSDGDKIKEALQRLKEYRLFKNEGLEGQKGCRMGNLA